MGQKFSKKWVNFYQKKQLVGDSKSTITATHSTGSVKGIATVGGLVGANSKSIMYSYSSATVTEDTTGNHFGAIGGLVGLSQTSIKNSYATGDVTGSKEVGGLIGFAYGGGYVENSYSVGKVTGNTNVGGLIGKNSVTVYPNISSFYDKTINPGMFDEASYGKTTAQLQNKNTFVGYNMTEDSTLSSNYRYPVFQQGEVLAWALYKAPTSTSSTSTSSTSTASNQRDDVVVAIDNGSATQVQLPETRQQQNRRMFFAPQDSQTPQMKQMTLALAKNIGLVGNGLEITSTPDIGKNTEKLVTLKEIEKVMQGDNPDETTNPNVLAKKVQEMKIPLSKNSIVKIVNGGVKLPRGITQQFFVVSKI